MKKILLISLSLLFAGEMEVNGNLKVTGQIDASNQRVKNVGPPTDMRDAINAQALQDALRDDANYEYIYYRLLFKSDNILNSTIYYIEMDTGTDVTPSSNWSQKISTLVTEGWNLYQQIHPNTATIYVNQEIGQVFTSLAILRRPIDE